jgi:hypothetical protein
MADIRQDMTNGSQQTDPVVAKASPGKRVLVKVGPHHNQPHYGIFLFTGCYPKGEGSDTS